MTKDDDALEQEKEGASGESGIQGRVSGPRQMATHGETVLELLSSAKCIWIG